MLAVALLALEAAAGTRPITDFKSRQGTYCLKLDPITGDISCSLSSYGGSGCFLFVPPQPNMVGWSDPKSVRFALVDYAGLVSGFATTVDGSIIELPLSDGRAQVAVLLHTQNAFTWASDISSSFPGPDLFGHKLNEVRSGASAALGDSLLQLSFTNDAPGAPLPDLIQLFGCPDPKQELDVLSFRARASGSLPNGTPGRCEVTQTGLLGVDTNPNSRVSLDAFPAEKITIQATGR